MKWRYRNTVLTLCAVAFFTTMVARLAISPIAPLIIEDLNASKSLIGLALTGMWLAYALTQFPSGVLGSKYGEREVILVAVGGMSVMGVLLAMSPVFAVFLLACLPHRWVRRPSLHGGDDAHHPSVRRRRHCHRPPWVRRTDSRTGYAGRRLLGLRTVRLVRSVAARHCGPLGVALFYAKVRPTEPTDPSISFREPVRVDLLEELLSRSEISFTVWLGVATEFINQGLLSFLPTFLVEYHGYTPTEAALLFSAFFLVLAVVVVGNLSDRYGRDLAIGGCMVIAAVVLGGSTTSVVLAGVMLLGLGTCAVIVVQPRILVHL